MTQAELTETWDGQLILMTRRAGLSDITRRFDITWFLGAIHKYRYLLTEVLVASFFCTCVALSSRLFFQLLSAKVWCIGPSVPSTSWSPVWWLSRFSRPFL